MRSFTIIPSVNFKDKSAVQAASSSDVRKLANRCWNTNRNTKTLPQPIPGPGHDGSRPTSILSLPLLPSQQTFNPWADPPNTPHQDRHCHSGLRGSSKEPFPPIPSKCRTASRQSSFSLPRNDVGRGRNGKRRKPSKRYREVFVWEHKTRTCSDTGMNSITNESHISVETDYSLKSGADNQGRNVYTPKGNHPVKYKIVSIDVLVIRNMYSELPHWHTKQLLCL